MTRSPAKDSDVLRLPAPEWGLLPQGLDLAGKVERRLHEWLERADMDPGKALPVALKFLEYQAKKANPEWGKDLEGGDDGGV